MFVKSLHGLQRISCEAGIDGATGGGRRVEATKAESGFLYSTGFRYTYSVFDFSFHSAAGKEPFLQHKGRYVVVVYRAAMLMWRHEQMGASQQDIEGRIALIGHSGAGKTECLQKLGRDLAAADMDVVFGVKASHTGDEATQSLKRALTWLTNSATPDVVTISNDEEMLKLMASEKESGVKYADQFHLVYLDKPLVKLCKDLNKPTAGQNNARKPDDIKHTIVHYERLDCLYRKLADQTVDCDRSAKMVALKISHIASRLRNKP